MRKYEASRSGECCMKSIEEINRDIARNKEMIAQNKRMIRQNNVVLVILMFGLAFQLFCIIMAFLSK